MVQNIKNICKKCCKYSCLQQDSCFALDAWFPPLKALGTSAFEIHRLTPTAGLQTFFHTWTHTHCLSLSTPPTTALRQSIYSAAGPWILLVLAVSQTDRTCRWVSQSTLGPSGPFSSQSAETLVSPLTGTDLHPLWCLPPTLLTVFAEGWLSLIITQVCLYVFVRYSHSLQSRVFCCLLFSSVSSQSPNCPHWDTCSIWAFCGAWSPDYLQREWMRMSAEGKRKRWDWLYTYAIRIWLEVHKLTWEVRSSPKSYTHRV